MVELVDEADLPAAERGARVVAEPRRRLAADEDLAGIGLLEQPGDVEERRLSGAGRRDERHHLAGGDREARVLQHLTSGPEPVV